MTDPAPHRRHSRRIVATRLARVAWIQAKHVEHVSKVEADRENKQLHLAAHAHRGVAQLGDDAQVADRAARIEVQFDRTAQRGVRLAQPRNPATTMDERALELAERAALRETAEGASCLAHDYSGCTPRRVDTGQEKRWGLRARRAH